jgi:hypothetical protein
MFYCLVWPSLWCFVRSLLEPPLSLDFVPCCCKIIHPLDKATSRRDRGAIDLFPKTAPLVRKHEVAHDLETAHQGPNHRGVERTGAAPFEPRWSQVQFLPGAPITSLVLTNS